MWGRRRLATAGREDGQILVLVAIALFFVLLIAAAFALDYGNALVQKQRLQNAADAAVLAATQVIASGGSEGDAVAQAQSLVTSNTAGAVSLLYPGDGSGSGLTNGIEISSGDVRVALRRSVQAFFAPILGVNTLNVSVRSRGMVGPYGVLPIAAKRFSGGDTSFPLGSGGNPTTVRDYLRPATYDEISSWPSPLTAPASMSAEYTSPSSYNPALSGRVFPILGQDTQSNVAGGNDFHGFIAPDVRDITHVVPTFYNAVTAATSIQNLKDVESSYFLTKGYPGPNPGVGAQIGVLNGSNVNHTVDALRKTYRRGDLVTAMIYDGTVYRKPEFDLTIDAAVKSSADIGPSGSPLTFQITLVPRNGFVSSGVQFSATGLDGWADWRFNSGALNTTYSTAVSGSNVVLAFEVSASSTVGGVRTALIRAYDPGTGNFRTISATLVVGLAASYSLSCAEGYRVIEQGSWSRFNLSLQGWNSYPTTDVTVSSPQWYTTDNPPVPVSPPSGISVSLPSTVRVRDGQSTALRADVTVSSAAATGEWLLKISVTDGDPSRDQEILLNVWTILAGTGPTAGNTTSFVTVLGYANLVITYANNASSPSPSLDNNSIYAYVVSPLVSDITSLGRGLSPRLLSWSQSP